MNNTENKEEEVFLLHPIPLLIHQLQKIDTLLNLMNVNKNKLGLAKVLAPSIIGLIDMALNLPDDGTKDAKTDFKLHTLKAFLEAASKGVFDKEIEEKINFEKVDTIPLTEQLEESEIYESYGIEHCIDTGTKVLTVYAKNNKGEILDKVHLHAGEDQSLESLDADKTQAFELGYEQAKKEFNKTYWVGLKCPDGNNICIGINTEESDEVFPNIDVSSKNMHYEDEWSLNMPPNYVLSITDANEPVFDNDDELIVNFKD